MRVQVWVDQAAHKAVRDVTIYSQGVREEKRLKLFEAMKIAVSDAGDACKEPVSMVGV